MEDYFVGKARKAFVEMKGNPENSGPLAEWARAAHAAGDPEVVAIVAADGEILGEARYHNDRVSAAYVRSVVNAERDKDLINVELGLALPRFRRRHGQNVVGFKYSRVCRGPRVKD